MVTIEDASRRRRIAEKAFEDHDWSNCVLNAQMCIELSLKSLLDTLEIKYNKGHRDYLHPLEKLSENIDKICEKLKIEQEFEKNLVARDFIRALLW